MKKTLLRGEQGIEVGGGGGALRLVETFWIVETFFSESLSVS